jgi:hypothetical protein
MDAERKSVDLRKQVAQQKQRVFEIADKFEELKVFERLPKSDRDELEMMLYRYQQQHGPVVFQYWLRAVVRSMRENINHLNQVLVYELQSRSDSDNQKVKFLDVMAKQMGLDVTITNNRVPKPGKKRKVIPRRQSHDD